MEEKKSGFLGLFKRKKKDSIAEATPPPEQPIQKPASIHGAEIREQKLKKRGKKEAQTGYANLVKDAASGQIISGTPKKDSEQIKKEGEKVAMAQLQNQADSVQKKSAPIGPPADRARRIFNAGPKVETPVSPAQPQDTIKPTPPPEQSETIPAPTVIPTPMPSQEKVKEPA